VVDVNELERADLIGKTKRVLHHILSNVQVIGSRTGRSATQSPLATRQYMIGK